MLRWNVFATLTQSQQAANNVHRHISDNQNYTTTALPVHQQAKNTRAVWPQLILKSYFTCAFNSI